MAFNSRVYTLNTNSVTGFVILTFYFISLLLSVIFTLKEEEDLPCLFTFQRYLEFRALILNHYQGWQTFPVKGKILIVLGFVDYSVSVATVHLCQCNIKAATDNK